MLQVNSLNLLWFGWQQPRGEPRRMPRARADTRHCNVSPDLGGVSSTRTRGLCGCNLGVNLGGCIVHGEYVDRGLRQSWDESAVIVERKRWSYLGVRPEVAVCLVATTATQAGRVESHARDPVLWVTAASRWISEEASCTGIASRTRANSRSKCRGRREKAMIIPRS